MRTEHLRPLPASLVVATLTLEFAAVGLSWGREPYWDTVLNCVYAIALSGAGAMIASRHPTNPVGWLFCVVGLQNGSISDLAQGWGLAGADYGWPGASLAQLIFASTFVYGGAGTVVISLLFPAGKMLSQRWWAVAVAGILGAALASAGIGLDPGTTEEFSSGVNPYATDALPTQAMNVVGMCLLASAMMGSVAALIVRFRRGTAIERQQLKWFVFASAWAAVTPPLTFVFWYSIPAVRPLAVMSVISVPVAAGIAMLRYRLFDIDLIISRTVAYLGLTIVLAGAWAASALAIGLAVGRGSGWATAGATLVAAVVFGLLRSRTQSLVDRRFRRARYAALAQVAAFLDYLRADRAEPEQLQEVMRAALADHSVELRFLLRDRQAYADIYGAPVEHAPTAGRESVSIVRSRTNIGIVLYDPNVRSDDGLLRAVIEAAGLAIEVVRLRVEVLAQLDEVRASRARVVEAAEDERRRIERDLHDGAQQRLVSIGLALRHAQYQLGSAPSSVDRTLNEAVAEITIAIQELRELARGVRPSGLDDGLAIALRDLAHRAPLEVEVRADSSRYAADLETAAYFVACEGLTNAVKHAHASKVILEVAATQGVMSVSVTDDGIGGASPQAGRGLVGLSDRVAARGGKLLIETVAGKGTRVAAEFPCAL